MANALGSLLRESREKKDRTRGQMAELIGITERRMLDWEGGDVGGASIAKIAALAKMLEIPADEVLTAAFAVWREDPANAARSVLLAAGLRAEQRRVPEPDARADASELREQLRKGRGSGRRQRDPEA